MPISEKNNCSTTPNINSADLISLNNIVWDSVDPISDCFNICRFDPITPLIVDITNYICQILKDIDISGVVLSQEFINKLGTKDKNIANLFQLLFDNQTTLKDLIESIENEVDTINNLNVNWNCIANPGSTTINQGIQLIINSFCNLKADYEAFKTDIVNDVNGDISSALDNLISSTQPNRVIKPVSGSTKYRLRGFVPPHCPIAYVGPLTNFDSTGKGIGSMDGWYLCNGNNGTFDLRGYTIVCAVQGMGGTNLLHPRVNPGSNDGQGNYALGNVVGSIRRTLNANNLPSHTHSATSIVVDPGHTHPYTNWPNKGIKGKGDGDATSNHTATTQTTGISYTGISVGTTVHANVTSNTPFDLRSPLKAAYYIQMID